MQGKKRILEFVEPLFGQSVEIYDDEWEKPLSFNINKDFVERVLETYPPERFDNDEWYFISNIYWGLGYNSVLYMNLDGEYKIIHV